MMNTKEATFSIQKTGTAHICILKHGLSLLCAGLFCWV